MGRRRYQGQTEVICRAAPEAQDMTCRRTRFQDSVDEEARRKNRTKSKVRAKVEHVFRILKRVFSFTKVRYRGFFINDEDPCLKGWATKQFGGVNAAMYAHVFELLLRMKGNYLWPAMWGNAFNEDDPENPRLADEYGIVMGTSHHEPMLRAQQRGRLRAEPAADRTVGRLKADRQAAGQPQIPAGPDRHRLSRHPIGGQPGPETRVGQ